MKATSLIWLISIINSLFIIPACSAQNPSQELLEDVLEDLSVHNDVNSSVHNPMDNSSWEEVIEALSFRLKEPLNLNTATRQQLEQFPFLSDIQIEQLLAYLYIHGSMETVYELQLIEGMDRQTISRLLPFVCVKPVEKSVNSEWKNMFKKALQSGRHEFITRFDIPFYKRKGYKQSYLGPSVYNSFRYAFRYKDQLYAGIGGEKDAGEPFGALHNRKGYDAYSYYLLLKNWGWCKTLALGNYRLSFGHGLVVNTDLLVGKTGYASSFHFRSGGIKKLASIDEYAYFRGVAATVIPAKHWEVSGFYSHRSMDGVITNGKITSIYKSGLHRSKLEASKRNVFILQLMGGHVSYQQKRLKWGITGIYYFFNRPYQPKLTGYTKYHLRGTRFYNLGVDYAYRWNHFLFEGETAMGKQGWASFNKLVYCPVPNWQWMLIHRYYAYNYAAFFARSFGENSITQNEQGYYVGMTASPWVHWHFLASFDWFFFPWKTYRVGQSSRGMEGVVQATFTPCRSLSMDMRYRYKQKEREEMVEKRKRVCPVHHHQLRFRLNYSWGEVLSSRTILDYSHFLIQDKAADRGYQITQRISSRLPWTRLFADVQGSYFYTDSYDARVYVPERGLLYTFYTPSFQGKGIRLSIRLRYEVGEHVMLMAKYGETVYWDRHEIGTGMDLIAGNKKADLQMQLRIKF